MFRDHANQFLERQPADPVALAAARAKLQAALGNVLKDTISDTLGKPAPAPYHPGAEQASVRSLRNAFIALLGASPDPAAVNPECAAEVEPLDLFLSFTGLLAPQDEDSEGGG